MPQRSCLTVLFFVKRINSFIHSFQIKLNLINHYVLLARDAFVRRNRRAIAMMFVRLSLSGTGVHCDHTVHFSVELISYSNVLGTLTPKHVHLLSAVFFQFHLEERRVWICKLGEELNTNNDKLVVRR